MFWPGPSCLAKASWPDSELGEASSKLREWAKPMPQTDCVAMRQACAKLCGQLEDKQIPYKEYVEKKLLGEFRAEPLSEVVSKG